MNETPTTKFCVNCKHMFRRGRWKLLLCGHPTQRNLVTGEPEVTCERAREFDHRCGVNAIYFEMKNIYEGAR